MKTLLLIAGLLFISFASNAQFIGDTKTEMDLKLSEAGRHLRKGGNLMLVGFLVTSAGAAVAALSDDETQQIIGLSVAGAGAVVTVGGYIQITKAGKVLIGPKK